MDQALGDLEHARHDVAARFDDWACFSAQQAAEKALKGVLQRLGVEAWGHSVVDLLDEVATSQEVPQGLRDAALELDKAYTPTRTSPGHPAAATPRSKRQGSWTMPRGSSGSVKVFYPRYSRAGQIRLLNEHMPALRALFPVTRVVLFGSWATGRATAFSDIDLLVVYGGRTREDAYRLVRQAVPLKGLEPHVYSEQEAERLAPTLERMTREGVVLGC